MAGQILVRFRYGRLKTPRYGLRWLWRNFCIFKKTARHRGGPGNLRYDVEHFAIIAVKTFCGLIPGEMVPYIWGCSALLVHWRSRFFWRLINGGRFPVWGQTMLALPPVPSNDHPVRFADPLLLLHPLWSLARAFHRAKASLSQPRRRVLTSKVEQIRLKNCFTLTPLSHTHRPPQTMV